LLDITSTVVVSSGLAQWLSERVNNLLSITFKHVGMAAQLSKPANTNCHTALVDAGSTLAFSIFGNDALSILYPEAAG
jgi:hypothetical protein